MKKFDGTYKGSAILSKTSKMPGFSISTPAADCKTGSKLAKIPGSVCHGCYALKNAYVWRTTQTAMKRRQEFMTTDDWVEHMVEEVNRKRSPYFRWFDSGDLQSVKQGHEILEVCELTPDKFHWIPTREVKMWKTVLLQRKGMLPKNVVLRASATMINDQPVTSFEHTSTVHNDEYNGPSLGHICPAFQQGNQCGDCRACWDPKVKNVSYPKH